MSLAERRDHLCNVEAEALLLGALLADKGLLRTAAATLDEDDFAEPAHGRIFAAIADAVAKGRPATPILLRPQFEADEALKELGGAVYLVRLTADLQGLLAPREISRQIRDLADLRRIRRGAAEISAACGHADVSPTDVVSQLQALTESARDGSVFGILDSLDLATLANIKPAAKSMAIERLAPVGEVTLMTGPGSAGKSLLAQQFATAAAAGLNSLGFDIHGGSSIYLTCEDALATGPYLQGAGRRHGEPRWQTEPDQPLRRARQRARSQPGP